MNLDKFTIYAQLKGGPLQVIGTAETREQAETFAGGALAAYCYLNGKTEEDIVSEDDVFIVGQFTVRIETDW